MRISQTSGEGYGRNPSPWPLITPHVPQAPPWPHWASSHLSPTSSLDSSCPLDFSVTWGDLRGAPLPPRQSSPLLAAAARASGVPVSLLTVHSISLTPSVRGANSGVSYSQLCSPPPGPAFNSARSRCSGVVREWQPGSGQLGAPPPADPPVQVAAPNPLLRLGAGETSGSSCRRPHGKLHFNVKEYLDQAD